MPISKQCNGFCNLELPATTGSKHFWAILMNVSIQFLTNLVGRTNGSNDFSPNRLLPWLACYMWQHFTHDTTKALIKISIKSILLKDANVTLTSYHNAMMSQYLVLWVRPSRQITTPASHHSVFLQAGCPSCRPTNSIKALYSLISYSVHNNRTSTYWVWTAAERPRDALWY